MQTEFTGNGLHRLRKKSRNSLRLAAENFKEKGEMGDWKPIHSTAGNIGKETYEHD